MQLAGQGQGPKLAGKILNSRPSREAERAHGRPAGGVIRARGVAGGLHGTHQHEPAPPQGAAPASSDERRPRRGDKTSTAQTKDSACCRCACPVWCRQAGGSSGTSRAELQQLRCAAGAARRGPHSKAAGGGGETTPGGSAAGGRLRATGAAGGLCGRTTQASAQAARAVSCRAERSSAA